jgi:hypothetical protein
LLVVETVETSNDTVVTNIFPNGTSEVEVLQIDNTISGEFALIPKANNSIIDSPSYEIHVTFEEVTERSPVEISNSSQSVDWPVDFTAELFTLETTDASGSNASLEGITLRSVLENGAACAITGVLNTAARTIQVVPNVTYTSSDDGSFKFGFEISGWPWTNPSPSETLEVVMRVEFREYLRWPETVVTQVVDDDGDVTFTEFTFETKRTVVPIVMPHKALVDNSRVVDVNISYALFPTDVLFVLTFPYFESSLLYDPDITVQLNLNDTVPEDDDDDGLDTVQIMVAVLLPVVFVLVLLILIVAIIWAVVQRIRLKQYYAKHPELLPKRKEDLEMDDVDVHDKAEEDESSEE